MLVINYTVTSHYCARTNKCGFVSPCNQVCLRLMKGRDIQLAQCDTSQGFLVTSGSAVLELQVGDTVSLHVTRYNTIVSQSSTSHTFTGFLIFATA